ANVLLLITEVIEDPTHLVCQNFVQFSKVYLAEQTQQIYFIMSMQPCQELFLIPMSAKQAT
ncbi:hypothetical protein, partial [Limosilactobacillus sp.]|uniref:hypothetical protein n=1 Tax=Limosilactobacillus sp. TaxID=2773925 RepID=UPI003F0607D3